MQFPAPARALPPDRTATSASASPPTHSHASTARSPAASRAPSEAAVSGDRYDHPTAASMPRSSGDRLPAQSPSDSSASSGSRASSRSYRSSSSGSKSKLGKGASYDEARAGKKRPLSAYNVQAEAHHAKHRRVQEDDLDEPADEDDEQPPRRWGRGRSASPPLASERSGGKLIRARPMSPPASTAPLGQHQHRTARMTEHLFQHSTALLHQSTLESEVRTEDLREEIRRQREEQEKYDRKLRSLLRTLETLDPAAAAAHARGESIALIPGTRQPEGSLNRQQRSQAPPDPTTATEQAVDMLIPPNVPEREAGIRDCAQVYSVKQETFSGELRGVDYCPQPDRALL